MNVNPLIISALSQFNKPVFPDVYKGEEREYFTFNYSDERPLLIADNEDIMDDTTIQVHYFTPNDPHTMKKNIRQALREKDFIIMNTSQFYESDKDLNHVVVEAGIEGFIDD